MKHNNSKYRGYKSSFFSLMMIAGTTSAFGQQPLTPQDTITGPYGNKTSQKEMLGSAQTVKGAVLEKYLSTDILTGLQGRLAGFNVFQYRGAFSPRTAANFSSSAYDGNVLAHAGQGVYGDNTMFSLSARGNNPVVIVDGVERDLFSIDPEMVESVTLERDALSSMFLGMKSSRGALIITTKNPTQGLHVSLTGKLGINGTAKKMRPLSAYQYAYLLNEALQNDGKSPLYSGDDFAAYRNHTNSYTHPDVDWYDEILKDNSVSQSYNLNVSGGGKTAQFFVSLGYDNWGGLFKRNSRDYGYNTNLKYNRYMLSSKVNINITDDFKASMSVIGRVTEGNQPGGDGSGYGSILNGIYNLPSNAYSIKNPNGSWGGTVGLTNNLMSMAQESGYLADNARDIMATGHLDYDFNKLVRGLSVHFLGSITAQSRTLIERTKRNPVYSYIQNDGKDIYMQYGSPSPQNNNFRSVATYQNLYGQLDVDYERTFGLHYLKASLAADTRHEINDFDLPMLPSNIMTRLEYNYNKKYFAQAALTQSYYNRYAPGHRWGTFWAAGLGWEIANEDFMKDLTWLNQLKLRATYGLTGSGISNSGYYSYRQTFQNIGSEWYLFGDTQTKNSLTHENSPLANPFITWEKAHKLNVGLDVSVLDQRLSATVDFYNDNYYDMLQTRGKSIELIGQSYPNENIGKQRRTGFEVSLGWKDRISSFSYYVSADWSIEKTKMVFMDEQTQPYDYLYRTGQPLGAAFGLVADGFLTQQDIDNNYPIMAGYTVQPGDVKYKDLNGDGIIDEYDRTVIGGDKPLQSFGIDLGLQWKGIEFTMFWQGVYDRDLYVGNRTLVEGFQSYGQAYGQAYENILNRWTPETASTATYPRLSAGGNNYNYGNNYNSSLWMHNGNFIRLKNIYLAYTFPKSFCKSKLGGVTPKIFVAAQNLLTFSACDLVDPEVEFTSYPLQRTVFTGINLTF